MRGTHTFAFSLLLALLVGACAAEPTGVGSEPAGAAGKADTATYEATAEDRRVEVTPLDGFVPGPSLLAKPGRRIVSTQDAFARFFGTAPPAHVDFDRQWVVFFTPGPRDRGRYDANVTIAVHPSGRSLRVRREIGEPGRGCFGVEAPTPFFVGTFTPPEGILPQSVRYSTRARPRDCVADAACGGALMDELARAAVLPNGEELTYMSEADYPFTPVDLGAVHGATIHIADVARRAIDSGLWDETLSNFREYNDESLPTDTDALVQRLIEGDGDYFRSSETDFDGWFDYDARWDMSEDEIADMPDEWERNELIGYRQLYHALTDNLSDLKVYRFFDVEVHILIVGRTTCGRLVGYETISIET
jgi:hypothetical protein